MDRNQALWGGMAGGVVGMVGVKKNITTLNRKENAHQDRIYPHPLGDVVQSTQKGHREKHPENTLKTPEPP